MRVLKTGMSRKAARQLNAAGAFSRGRESLSVNISAGHVFDKAGDQENITRTSTVGGLMRKRLGVVTAAVSAMAVIAGGSTYALAGPSVGWAVGQAQAAPSNREYYACAKIGSTGGLSRPVFNLNVGTPLACPPLSFQIHWYERGATGELVDSEKLPPENIPTQLQHTGGSILAGRTDVLAMNLPEGTYEINADALFQLSASAAADQIPYGYLALWTGATPDTPWTSFDQGAGTYTTGPLTNPLASGAVIDASATGSNILVVPAGGETLHLAVFAYTRPNPGGNSRNYSGCVGTTGANPCDAAKLGVPGSTTISQAELDAIRVK